jgi:hypothetical protein
MLQSLAGHGRRWWRGVSGAAGKWVVTVDLRGRAMLGLQWLLLFVCHRHHQQSAEWQCGFMQQHRRQSDASNKQAVAVLSSPLFLVCIRLGSY